MECRRAFEIDLGAYLRDPRARAWDDFRAHYPRCAACAAEVHAHTEVALLLAPEHPDPERLLRFEDAAASLDAAERASITTHLAGCVTCRDELTAVRRFAPAVEAAAAAAPRRAVVARRRWLPAFGEWLWQPAVAWAAVLVLVVYSSLGPASRQMFERPVPLGVTKDERKVAEAPPQRERAFGFAEEAAEGQPSAKPAPPPSPAPAAPLADGLKARAPAPPPVVQSAPPPSPAKKTGGAPKNESAPATSNARPRVEQRRDSEDEVAGTDAEKHMVVPQPAPSMRRKGDVGATTGALGSAVPSPQGGAAGGPSGEPAQPRDRPQHAGADVARGGSAPPQSESAVTLGRSARTEADADTAREQTAPVESEPDGAREDGAPAEAAPRALETAPPPPPPPAPLAKEKLAALDARQRLAAIADAPVGATLAPHPDAANVAVLEITPPNAPPPEVDVELRATDGRRRLSERMTSPARTIALSVAADWLDGGPYDVSVRDPSGRLLYTTRVQVRR